jgi:hypothetical protein
MFWTAWHCKGIAATLKNRWPSDVVSNATMDPSKPRRRRHRSSQPLLQQLVMQKKVPCASSMPHQLRAISTRKAGNWSDLISQMNIIFQKWL